MSINKSGKDNNMNNRSSIRQNLRIGIFIILMSFMTWNLTASKPITVALVYTVTTPELKADVVREIREQVGADAKLLTYEVPEAFEEIKRTGCVTALPTAPFRLPQGAAAYRLVSFPGKSFSTIPFLRI